MNFCPNCGHDLRGGGGAGVPATPVVGGGGGGGVQPVRDMLDGKTS